MNIYFIAGESSGDFIGSRVMDAIKHLSAGDVSFYGIGGSNMTASGLHSLFDIKEISLIGFFEILPHVFRLKKLIDRTVRDVIAQKAHVLVTIDCPGFSFRVAKKVRKAVPHIKLVHIVAPSVWAYKPGRALEYAKLYDKLLTLLPFEPPYFIKYGLDTECIGHPVLEQKFFTNKVHLRKEFGIPPDCKVIAITPGSRKAEIVRHMKVIRDALCILVQNNKQKIIAVFVQPNDDYKEVIVEHMKGAEGLGFYISTERLKTFAMADVAIAKSGTNTIEIAASKTPMIVGYKLGTLSFLLIKLLIKIKYVSIINIIPNEEIIPEYIQSDFTASNIAISLGNLLRDNQKQGQIQVARSLEVLESIGLHSEETPSQKAARAILELVI